MYITTLPHPGRAFWRLLWVLHLLALVSFLVLTLSGHSPESTAGWLSVPAVVYVRGHQRLRRRQGYLVVRAHRPFWLALRAYARLSWPGLVWQVGVLLVLAGPGQAALVLPLPLLRWLVGLSALLWPNWGLRPEMRALSVGLFRCQQVLVLALVGAWLGRYFDHAGVSWSLTMGLSIGMLATEGTAERKLPWAEGRQLSDGTYELHLSGPFVIRYQPVDEFDRRLFFLFLRQIRLVDGPPKQPFLRQEWLASWFGTLQELLSRWESYHRQGDWRRLMSRNPGPPFSLEERQPILALWATNFWWTPAELAAQLGVEGLQATAGGLESLAKESGFWWLRQLMLSRFAAGAAALQPRDGWLVRQLFRLVEGLLTKLEAGGELTVEERLEIRALVGQRPAAVLPLVGPAAAPTVREEGQVAGEKGLPLRYALERMLFGWWEEVAEEGIGCPHCHSTRVRRKSRQGRPKRFQDAQGRPVVVEVQRYYCGNKACPHRTFTLLPPGLLPYSPWPQFFRWQALQQYVWKRGSYRLVARALGVSLPTAYRWVSACGQQLLPVGALFGLVRCSGVVGVDEKWVKVPKNDKPPGKHQQWMYVYLAVDVYTYDLLHIAIFPYDNSDSAQTFLWQLRAKGYHPQVMVTDLRRDYGEVIAAVFPQAEHHECIFHALQSWGQQLREVYGADYREKNPQAAALHDSLRQIFAAKSKRTAHKRYQELLALRQEYLKQTPAVDSVFTSLEKHFPKLVNAIESERIPRTNNAVETVIRRFEQHYRGFAGFDSLETAQKYLAVWELVYRFTPFSADAQPHIRGKCPLELAGYPVQQFHLLHALRGATPYQSNQQLARKEVVPTA